MYDRRASAYGVGDVAAPPKKDEPPPPSLARRYFTRVDAALDGYDAAPDPDGLEARERRFVDEYLVDLDLSATATRCRLTLKEAKKCLARKDVKAALARAQAARLERVGVEAETVLRELLLIGTSSVGDFVVKADGAVTLAEGVPEVYLRAVSSVKRRFITTKAGASVVEVEIKLWDKPGSLKTLAQHLDILRGRDPDAPLGGESPEGKPTIRGLSDEAAEAIKAKVMGLKP